MNLQESILKNLDIDYSYRLAKRMEQFRTNPVLGYRPPVPAPSLRPVKC